MLYSYTGYYKPCSYLLEPKADNILSFFANIHVVSRSKLKLSPSHLLTTRIAIWCMMNSDNAKAGTETRETLESTGWEEDDLEDDPEMVEEWRTYLEGADGLLNTDNETPRYWGHSNPWIGKDGRKRWVRGHHRASATVYFTDLHLLAL